MSAPKPKLEPTVALPNGALAPRCQRIKRDGAQCGKAARSGRDVCGVHGGGYAKREREGSRKPPGRPPTHGLYSKTGLQSVRAIRDEVAALRIDLDDTDEEMRTVKAVLWHLLEQADRWNSKALMLEAALEAVGDVLASADVIRDGVPGKGQLTVAQARTMAQQLSQGARLVSEIDGWTARLLEANVKAIAASKMRAETRARMAESKAHETFLELARRITAIVWELAPDSQWIDTYEDRLMRDVLGPNRLELPSGDPEKLN